MQNYSNIPTSEKLKDSRSRINDNFDSVKSDFSGTLFPTLNLSVGQNCYRTDLRKLFKLTQINPDVWVEIFDINHPYASLDYVDGELDKVVKKAEPNFDKKVTAPVFEGELNGNAETATRLKNPFTLTLVDGIESLPVTVDGSGNVTVEATRVDANIVDGSVALATEAVHTVNADHSINSDRATRAVDSDNADRLTGLSSTSSWFDGSLQQYRCIGMEGNIVNVIDAEGGSGNRYRDFFRAYPSIPAGTYNLQQILQELVYRSRTVDIYREYFNCNCQCDCDCSDDSN